MSPTRPWYTVRLINIHTKNLEDFIDDTEPTPPYAILSHTWGPDHEEISFQDLQVEEVKTGPGREKFEASCAQAILDDLSYVWIDTCCIDKTNSTELTINSMFKWYKNARLCYAYLCDVDSAENIFESQSTFRKSRWFRRGWTLQELIAPEVLRFYDCNWRAIGHKRDPQVVAALVQITHIPRMFLLGIVPMNEASVAQRMSWAANRVTKRTEDLAYCLLGIFDITMPMVYGEGDKAFLRLQEVIARHINDDSILAWNFSKGSTSTKLSVVESGGALAKSPSSFAYCSHIVPSNPSSHVGGPLNTHGGSVLLRRNVHTDSSGQRFVILQCQLDDQPTTAIGIPYIRHPKQPAIPIENNAVSATIEEVRIPKMTWS
ncbi:heterokaryon incompatibility protein-domain-containing protein [Xylaria scruposa]|nr:heterokaryon incompatibility protein-domain-containing protein [Xylaria scruposa]